MDWQTITIIVLAIIAVVAGGLARKWLKELTELAHAITGFLDEWVGAIEDGRIDTDEQNRLAIRLRAIIEEGKDVIEIIKTIAGLIAKYRLR